MLIELGSLLVHETPRIDPKGFPTPTKHPVPRRPRHPVRAIAAYMLIALAVFSQGVPAAEAGLYPPPPQPEQTQTVLPRYTFDVHLDYAAHQLDAVEQVAVPNLSGATLAEVVFNVPPAHKDGLFSLRDVQVGETSAAFDLVGTVLSVTLPAGLAPGGMVTVTMDLSLHVPPLGEDVESFAEANLSYTEEAMTVGNWYPVLAPYRAGLGWLHVPWHTIGDPFVGESADYFVTITATPGVDIVAGGDVTREGDVWRIDLPVGRTFAFVASPRYWRTDVAVGGVTYSLYTFDRHLHLAPVTLQTVIRSAWLYTALYGPYPYSTLRVAEVEGKWSMEFSGLVALGAVEFESYNGTNRNRLVRITAHEVSHQWWYGVVGNDQAREPWLDEAMARFNELRYYEFYSPRDVGWWWDEVIYRTQPAGAVDSSIYDFDFHSSYLNHVYNRGAVFLDTLRVHMGERAFNAFLRDLYRRGAFRLITARDFLEVLNEHSPADVRLVIWRFLMNQ